MKVLGFESTITLNFWSLFVDPACRGAMAAVQGAEIHKRRVGREERGDEFSDIFVFLCHAEAQKQQKIFP